MLRKVTPISDNPEFVTSFANHVANNANKVCAVCGLGVTGHAPESGWLGYQTHKWQGVTATTEQLRHASELTTQAYAARVNHCGHRFESRRCLVDCIHTEGHCQYCAY